MNDRELQLRVREAFDAVELPADVKQSTLAALQAVRQAQEESSVQDVETSAPSPAVRVVAHRRRKRFALLAAAACFVLALVGCFRVYTEPTAYVDIDINPSIELGINRFDRVISTKALNDDGAAVLGEVSVWGLPYEEACTKLQSSEAFSSYLQPESYMEIVVVAQDGQQLSTLQDQSDAYLQTLPCEGSCASASEAEHEEAQQAGMGVGRYQAAQTLLELDPTLTLEDCSSMTMRELRDHIAAHESESGDEASAHTDSHGQGSGNGATEGHGQGQAAGQGSGQGMGQGAGSGRAQSGQHTN